MGNQSSANNKTGLSGKTVHPLVLSRKFQERTFVGKMFAPKLEKESNKLYHNDDEQCIINCCRCQFLTSMH